jgi:hypothetical protein
MLRKLLSFDIPPIGKNLTTVAWSRVMPFAGLLMSACSKLPGQKQLKLRTRTRYQLDLAGDGSNLRPFDVEEKAEARDDIGARNRWDDRETKSKVPLWSLGMPAQQVSLRT